MRRRAQPAPSTPRAESERPEPRATDAALQPNPDAAWNRRKRAAEKYRPGRIRLLLIAESPPSDPERYIYFEEPGSEDPLFENVAQVLFEEPPRATSKALYLAQMRRRGVFVIELKPDSPRRGEPLSGYVPWLLLGPSIGAAEHVVLIGDVYEAAHQKLGAAGLPVVDVPVPSPAGDDAFRRELRKALVRAGLEKLMKPLSAGVKAALERGASEEG